MADLHTSNFIAFFTLKSDFFSWLSIKKITRTRNQVCHATRLDQTQALPQQHIYRITIYP